MSEEIRNDVEMEERTEEETQVYTEPDSKNGFDVTSGLIGAGAGLAIGAIVLGVKKFKKKRAQKAEEGTETVKKEKVSFMKKIRNMKKKEADKEEEYLDKEDVEVVKGEVV